MFIKLAKTTDAPIIHQIMIKAFTKYKDDEFPSSALNETVESIHTAMQQNERAFICYTGETPIGMVRFQKREDGIYFYRLSVIPTEQGKGIAKKIVAHLEAYAKEDDVMNIYCKVRQSEGRNMSLYRSLGYDIYGTSVVERHNGKMKIVSMKKQL